MRVFISTMLAASWVAITPFSPASAEEKKIAPPTTGQTLAVNTFDARGITADEAATLNDVLRSELTATGKFIVMERGQMEAVLKEQGFQQSGACTDAACLVEIGQLLGAQLLVAGSFGKVGKAYSITARIISVQNGVITTTVSHNYTGPVENLLTSEMTIVAKKLAGIEPAVGARVKGKDKTPLVIGAVGVGVAVVGGGVAFLVLSKMKTNPPETGNVGGDGEVVVSW